MTQASGQLQYKRILLKLSGEALQGDDAFGINPQVLDRTANEVAELVELGVGRSPDQAS